VESIDEHGITLKILGTVRASEQWAAGGEFRRLLLETFAKNGIQLPGPQQVFVPQPQPAVTQAPEPLGKAPSQDDLADE
jgi:small-conductance mechanosensitive channel